MAEQPNTLVGTGIAGEAALICLIERGFICMWCDLLTLGILWIGFHANLRENDGERV